MTELIKQTNAYKVIKGDKKLGLLSHAYLIECPDALYLRKYLKIFAKLILCESEEFCDECRVCRLIERETHPDVSFYPSNGEKLKSACPDDIVSACAIKPLELKKRMFVIDGFDALEKSQNKLLKTLEEPPENVILLLGTSNVSAILPTVKSRVKKLDIPVFSENKLFEALKNEYSDKEKLITAISLSNGLVGEVEQNYNRSDVGNVKSLAISLLKNLNSSRDIADFSAQIKDVDLKLFTSVLKMCLGELIHSKNGAISRLTDENTLSMLNKKYSMGAVCEIVTNLTQFEMALKFNANQVMAVDKMLFIILEATHKWQKLSV